MFLQDEPNPAILNILPIPITPNLKTPSIQPASWIKVRGASLVLGMDDAEEADFVDDSKVTPFGWDNEKPSHMVEVPSFEIQHRPVTVSEYAAFLEIMKWKTDLIPASWVKMGSSSWFARSLYGPIPIENASLWPVSVSHTQAQCYVSYFGLALASEEQYCLARATVPDSLQLNHSFSHFCPTPVAIESKVVTDIVGSGWEWTSTTFAEFPGFAASSLYPDYSADFL